MHISKPDTFQEKINDILSEFENLICLDGIRIACTQDGSLIPALDPITSFKAFKARDGIEGIIYQILRDACLKSERLGPGSTQPLVRFVSRTYKELQKTKISLKDFNRCCETFKSALKQSIQRPSKNMIEQMSKEMMNDSKLSDILLEAIGLAGNECRIFVKKSPSNQTVLELTNGYTFEISPNKLFYRNNAWKENDVKCLIVDGIIESVAEIHQFLESCTETKQAGAIFARGFAEEVIATLKLNFDRETLNIIPIIIGFDLETVNVLNDVAIVAGADLISSLKGQLISTVNPEKLPSIQLLECVDRTVTILNHKTGETVKTHVKNLQKNREATQIKDISDLLDKRIKSLSSAVVNIRIGSETNQQAHLRFEALDLGIRAVSSALKSGIIDVNEIKNEVSKANLEFQSSLGLIPSSTVYATIIYGTSVINALSSTGAILSFSSEA